MPQIWSQEIEIAEIYNQRCDLANIISLQKDLKNKEIDYRIQGYDTHGITAISRDFNTAFIYQSERADSRKLFIYRDSFCIAMSEVLASQFTDSYMMHYNNYHGYLIEEQDPDIFVLEIVERNIENLLEFDIEKE